jgi:hypothetical protein
MSIEAASPLAGSFGYIEATATWSTRYIDPSGFECLLSIQAESGSEALKKAESAISYLLDAQCIPLRKEAHNGDKKGNGKGSKPTVLVKPDGDGKNPICPIHGVEMTKWTKNGHTWYSHRWEDGWCNGKSNE